MWKNTNIAINPILTLRNNSIRRATHPTTPIVIFFPYQIHNRIKKKPKCKSRTRDITPFEHNIFEVDDVSLLRPYKNINQSPKTPKTKTQIPLSVRTYIRQIPMKKEEDCFITSVYKLYRYPELGP